jgi:predicted dinucleotide-utilizing enzyme
MNVGIVGLGHLGKIHLKLLGDIPEFTLSAIYDIDKTFIEEIIITDGGCIVLYNGGHSLTTLEENTIFYEIKTGPYFGYENDKEDI